MAIKVGTCGWSAKGGKKAYFRYFSVIEVQETFYRLPRIPTVEKWRQMAPENFEFTLKAWQVMTHPPSSPTWRKANIKVDEEARDKYGYLKPTEENFKAWEEFLEICIALRARICIFQTPPSFGYSEENLLNVERFFSCIDRRGMIIGWEPRGTWNEHLSAVKRLCEKLDLLHVTDPLRRMPVRLTDVAYFRLHGLGGREVNYRYKYSDEDLRQLKTIVEKLIKEGCSTVYVMFNNVYMFDDAIRFKQLVSGE